MTTATETPPEAPATTFDIQILRENLSAAIARVMPAVAARAVLPITATILCSTKDGQLELSATDLDIGITTRTGAKVDHEGAFALSARMFADVVGGFPEVPLHLWQDGNSARVEGARAEGTISMMDAGDFPRIAPPQGEGVDLRPADLAEIQSRIGIASSKDDTRPILTGAYLANRGGNWSAAAADGYRLAVLDFAGTLPASVVVPRRAISVAAKLFERDTEPLRLQISEHMTRLWITGRDATLGCMLLQGTFPNFQQLIPETWMSRLTFDVAAMKGALRLAGVYAKDGGGVVRLVATGDTVSISAGTVGGDFIGKAEIDCTRETNGVIADRSRIALNSVYLQEAVDALGTGTATLSLTSPSSQGVFRPVGEDGDRYVHVIMPMSVQWTGEDAS